MNAFLSSIPNSRSSRGMHHIKTKISALQEEYQKLLTQRQRDIASLIATLDLAHIDDQLLIGGLMFLKEKITTKDQLIKDWQDTGERFLRQAKKSQKLNPSKKASSPSPAHQSSQKHSQSREKQDEKATAVQS